MFLSDLRGAKNFSVAFRNRFSDPVSRFSKPCSYRIKNVSGAVSFSRRATLSKGFSKFLRWGLLVALKAFAPKRGLVFAANGASPPPHPRPLTPAPFLLEAGSGVLLKIPRGGGGGLPGEGGGEGKARGVYGELGGGGRRGPVYRENLPPFRRKRLPRLSVLTRIPVEIGLVQLHRENLNHATLVAFQTQTQNRSVLATQFPKSHPCPRW